MTEKVSLTCDLFKELILYSTVVITPFFIPVVTQVCVYAVAAILWATAKFSLSPTQKLAMPRKLKRLLLEMAKRTPIERPTIIMAKKVIFFDRFFKKRLIQILLHFSDH